jgi:hypothetical protein
MHHLGGLDHADMVVGYQRQRAAAGHRRRVQHDRAGLGGGCRRAGDDSGEPVEVESAE